MYKQLLTGTLLLMVSLMSAVVGSTAEDKESSCVMCHKSLTPGIVNQWKESTHAKAGIDCSACHSTEKDAPGSRDHMGAGSVTPVVSPKVCGKCHEREMKEFTNSHHASAAKFIGSLDNVLGEMIEGGPAANSGCKQCHGSTVSVKADGAIDAETWPNSGIGRINPDGSTGSCSACHSRHSFSLEQVRDPETCGKCHMGPDHPQIEIFNESKHGLAYKTHKSKMNLGSKQWVVGKDYSAAPTCATCHMGATATQSSTHDIGTRLSWTLRPAVSTKMDKWETKRTSMKNVCATCHSGSYIDNFYSQYDSSVELYNEKFAKPAKIMMDKLYAEKLLTDTPFDEKLEWTYYLMWHHEGRRARHGAAMLGPDYTQWHGFFEVADRFYNELIPVVKHLKPELVQDVLDSDYHKWKKGLSKEDREKIVDFYKKRYDQ